MKTKEPWQLYATVFWVSELAAAGELQIVLRKETTTPTSWRQGCP